MCSCSCSCLCSDCGGRVAIWMQLVGSRRDFCARILLLAMEGQKRNFEQAVEAVEDATSVASGPASGSLDMELACRKKIIVPGGGVPRPRILIRMSMR